MLVDINIVTAEKNSLNTLLSGYKTLLNSPFSDSLAKAELQEGIANRERRLLLVDQFLTAFNLLVADGWPNNPPEIADQSVIDALQALSDSVALVPKDFEPKPVVLADGLDVSITDN